MTVQNRTNEFFAAVESLKSRGSGAMQAAQLMNRLQANADQQRRLLDGGVGGGQQPFQQRKRTEFARQAAAVALEFNGVAAKLEKLTKLVKKKSLFDDKPVEIQELTFVIKEDINRLNGNIKGLEEYLKHQTGDIGNKQTQEHSSNIVVSLQSRLAGASMNLKDLLEIRSENMKSQQDRRNQFAFTSTTSAVAQSSNLASNSSPLYAPERRGEGGSQDFVSISIPQQQQQQQMQLQLTDQRDSYLDSRAEAIEGIEKTINELGSIFQQLTSMISAHDDLVRRIDYNVESVESNVTEGQRQLVRYMSSISSNRWLMAKIFMTVIFFFLLFVLFFA